ncbi:MAG: pilin [Betaproteobacteria bacterium]|nr:pilin [Betaproteobacteria bacterium]
MTRTTSQPQGGFTLLELMIVVAVIAILASISIPYFYGQIIRGQIVDSMSLAEVAKRAVSAVYTATGKLPENNEAASIPVSDKMVGNYVTRVEVIDGAITLTFGNNSHKQIAGKQLTLRPAIVADSPQVPIAWVCAARAVPNGMAAIGQDRTSIPVGWLPFNCR